MTIEDELFWDRHKHEENVATNRGSFFLVGQAMLFGAYAQLRAGDTSLTRETSLMCYLGIFVGVVWLLVSFLHFRGARQPVHEGLTNATDPLRAVVISAGSSTYRGPRSFGLMQVILPAGIILCWILLLGIVQRWHLMIP